MIVNNNSSTTDVTWIGMGYYLITAPLYGAKGDGVTDDRLAIQATINACDAGGGGTVYVPRGIYDLGTGFDTDSNAQLYFPYRDLDAIAGGTRVKILCAVGPNMYSNPFRRAGANSPPQTGCIFKSRLLADKAVIGVRYNKTREVESWTALNFIHPEIEGLQIHLASKQLINGVLTDVRAQATGIDMQECAYFTGKNILVCPESNTDVIAKPVDNTNNGTSYGIRMPRNNNFVNANLQSCTVYGVMCGFDLYEHSNLSQNCFADVCWVGVKINPGSHRTEIHGCCVARSRTNIQVVGGGNFTIDSITFEDDPAGNPSGSVPTPGWNHTVYDLEEVAGGGFGDGADGKARGYLKYHRVRSNFGVDYGAFSRLGSSVNVKIEKLWGDAAATTTPVDPFPTTNLLAYWSMDQASGNFFDTSGNGRDLTRVNGTTTGAGKVGSAAIMSAASAQALQGGAVGLSAGTGFTLAGWFRLNTTAEEYQVLAQKGSGASLEYSIYYTKSANLITASFYNSAGAATATVDIPFTSGPNWVYLDITFSGGTLKGTVNRGTPVTTTGALGQVNTVGNLFIGSNGSASSTLDGGVDEVGIWSVGLSDTDLNYLYNGGTGRTKPAVA